MRQERRVRQKRRDATENQRYLKRSNATEEGPAAHEECSGCSSLRVRGVELAMKSNGVEFQSLGG